MLPGVHAAYGTLLGRSAGVALLVILGGMKLIETRRLRDALVVCFLGYFLVITNFLYSQTILTGAFMFAAAIATTATLVSLCVPPGELPAIRRARLGASMLVQALPVMLVLFVLFPRVSAPLWGLPKDAHSGRTGLSETMRPGAISALSQSNAVAFRAVFDGPIPPPHQQYWRGPVLWHTDGFTWRAGQRRRSHRPVYVSIEGDPVDYVVILEPHQRRWLVALDIPATIPRGGQMTSDLQLKSVSPIRERMQYRVRSYPHYRLRHRPREQLIKGLALPDGRHPRALALGEQWRLELDDDAAIVERALDLFRRQPFFYTLSPPLMQTDPVDEFLFDVRRGFCENYASAFTVLMRAAGIPARVVTGYQGGEINPLGDYLLVRQRDAHAWAEVWLDERGWVRVDPTAAVAPERIERGIDAAIPPTLGPAALGIRPSEPVQRLWRRVRQSWDAANMRWNQWVLGYSAERQYALLARLGIDADNYPVVALLVFVSIGTLLCAVAGWLVWTRGPAVDPALRTYRRLCRKLSRRGVTRVPSEGPLDLARRVRLARPELVEAVDRAIALYVTLRYARATGDLARFRRAVVEV